MPSARPRPEHYHTASEYRRARKLWLRRHGGSFAAVLAIAVFFGLLSGSATALVLLVVFAILATMYARSRP
jgi:hypothetical protein